jgi:hypothetical protein
VLDAVKDISPRTVIDPRLGYRYVATVTSRVVKLQGGLVLRAIVTTPEAPAASDPMAKLRSIA